MSDTERNPHVTELASALVRTLNDALAGSLLDAKDQSLILLAAAHGRATQAGLTLEQLARNASEVWRACEAGRARKVESLDYDVRNLERKIFER